MNMKKIVRIEKKDLQFLDLYNGIPNKGYEHTGNIGYI